MGFPKLIHSIFPWVGLLVSWKQQQFVSCCWQKTDIIGIKREELIGKLINGLDDLRKTLTEEKVCLRGSGDSICSATMLGILMREAHKLTLLDPPLDSPYNGHSISSLKERIADFPMPRQDHHYHNSYNGYYQDTPVCTIHSRMGAVLKEIDDDIKRFDLTTQE